ncbi:hypothetical protein [Nocardia sp. NPDC056000]|uniref:hypothetical protein n=1 Tax=Nocardia sp. NPDC056000 TaxID=3345674 RepID=UPI0035D78D44
MPASTVYTGRVTNWPFLCLSLFASILMVYNMHMTPTRWAAPLYVLLILTLVKTVVDSSLRVSAGPTGLTVSMGLLGLPRARVARAAIVHAEPVFLRESPWRGWGIYRRGKRGWFLTPKFGPALRVHLASGRTMTISMPEPAAAVWAMGITP